MKFSSQKGPFSRQQRRRVSQVKELGRTERERERKGDRWFGILSHLAGNDAREHGNGHLNLLVPLVVARDVPGEKESEVRSENRQQGGGGDLPEESHEGLGSRAVHILAGHRRGRPVGLGVRTYLQTTAGLVLLRETRSLQSMVEPRRRRGHRKEAENRDKSQGSPPEGHHVRRSPAASIRVDF